LTASSTPTTITAATPPSEATHPSPELPTSRENTPRRRLSRCSVEVIADGDLVEVVRERVGKPCGACRTVDWLVPRCRWRCLLLRGVAEDAVTGCSVGSGEGCCCAPELQDVVGGGEQFPFAVDRLESTPVEPSCSSGFFDLSEDGLDGDGPFGVDGLAAFGVELAFHSLQRCRRGPDAAGARQWRVRSRSSGPGRDEQFGSRVDRCAWLTPVAGVGHDGTDRFAHPRDDQVLLRRCHHRGELVVVGGFLGDIGRDDGPGWR